MNWILATLFIVMMWFGCCKLSTSSSSSSSESQSQSQSQSECNCICGSCIDNIAPAVIKVVISGISNQNCTNCSIVNNTYFLPYIGIVDQGGTQRCRWYLDGLPSPCDDSNDFFLQVDRFPSNDMIVIYQKFDGGASGNIVRFDGDNIDDDCLNWNNLNIPDPIAFSSSCDVMSASCLITTV